MKPETQGAILAIVIILLAASCALTIGSYWLCKLL